MTHWNELPALIRSVNDDDMLVVVTARKGTISYKTAMDWLPEELAPHLRNHNTMIIFPDQYGKADLMTFTAAQHTEQLSAYDMLRALMHRIFG